MSDILIPYSFVPGTKAMASEVNANFIALANGVEDCKKNVANSIDELNEKVETRLDEAIGNKLDLKLVNSVNITNCLTEVPERIKYDLVNGVFTLKAGSVVIIPYGTIDRTSEFPLGSTIGCENLKVVDTQFSASGFFVWAELQSDVVTEQHSATAVNTRVISLKLANSSLTYNTAHHSTANPTFTSSVQFYNTSTNECWHTGSAGTSDYQLSFPICIAKSNTSYVYASIEQVFNGLGYIGSTAWIDKGIKGLIPNGRNNDGTLNNIEFTTPNLKVRTWVYESINQPLFYDVVADGTPSGGSYYVSEMEPISPATNWVMWYNPTENIMRYSGDNGRWTVYKNWLFMGVYTSSDAAANNYKLTQFTSPKTVFKAVDYNELEELKLLTAVQSKTLNGYCKLSNGLIIQWGQISAFSGTATITLPIPFSSTNYQPVACALAGGDYDANWDVRNYTTTSFQINQPSSGKKQMSWIAIGF